MKYEIVEKIEPRPEILKIFINQVDANFIFYFNGYAELYFLVCDNPHTWGFIFAGTRLHATGKNGVGIDLCHQANSQTAAIQKAFNDDHKVYATDSFSEACEILIERKDHA